MRWRIHRPHPLLMVQWGWPIFLSLGLHFDFRAPYLDLHLGAVIVTLGRIRKQADDYQAWWCAHLKQ
jgi:hypothetical protein